MNIPALPALPSDRRLVSLHSCLPTCGTVAALMAVHYALACCRLTGWTLWLLQCEWAQWGFAAQMLGSRTGKVWMCTAAACCTACHFTLNRCHTIDYARCRPAAIPVCKHSHGAACPGIYASERRACGTALQLPFPQHQHQASCGRHFPLRASQLVLLGFRMHANCVLHAKACTWPPLPTCVQGVLGAVES